MKKLCVGVVLLIMVVVFFSGFAAAQSGTYLPPPEGLPDWVEPPEVPDVPDLPEITAVPVLPEFPPECNRTSMIERVWIHLVLDGDSKILNATIPAELQPSTRVWWLSDNNNVAQVTMLTQNGQSTARVDPVGLGTAYVYIFVEAADGEVYCDKVFVRVKEEIKVLSATETAPDEEVAVAATTESSAAPYTGFLLGLIVVLAGYTVARRIRKKA